MFAVAMTLAAGLHADTIWDEGVDGPLSTNPASPTPLVLVSPSDLVIGGAPAGLHVFQITVPVGNTVTSMIAETATGLMTVEVVSASINCPPRMVHLTSVELLDGASCAPFLPAGDYTFIIDLDTPPQPWNVTIASDLPVELQSLIVE
jgi:hypothetical protein